MYVSMTRGGGGLSNEPDVLYTRSSCRKSSVSSVSIENWLLSAGVYHMQNNLSGGNLPICSPPWSHRRSGGKSAQGSRETLE